MRTAIFNQRESSELAPLIERRIDFPSFGDDVFMLGCLYFRYGVA